MPPAMPGGFRPPAQAAHCLATPRLGNGSRRAGEAVSWAQRLVWPKSPKGFKTMQLPGHQTSLPGGKGAGTPRSWWPVTSVRSLVCGTL